MSRHYYDIYRLMQAPEATAWMADVALAQDCVRHARMFFASPDLRLEGAVRGSFTLTPDPAMMDALSRDYAAMSAMIFGAVPPFEDVLHSIQALEIAINGRDF